MGTGCLTLARSLTLTLPEQGEVWGALRSEQNQQEYPAGRGGIGAEGRWETPPPGTGPRARCQSVRPTSIPSRHTLKA